MDVEDHRRAIWRRRRQILALSFVIAVLVFARSSGIDDVYGSDARLQALPGGAGADVPESRASFLATTYAALLGSDAVAERAASDSGLHLDESAAADRLSASVSSTAGFLTVSATGPSAEDAQALAQAAAEALSASVSSSEAARISSLLTPIDDQLDQLLSDLRAAPEESVERDVLQAQYQAVLARRTELAAQQPDELRVVDAAEAGGAPLSPTPARDAVLAFVVAMIVNAELAVLLEAVSGRFSGRDEEVTRLTGLPVLTRIPHADQGDTVEALRVLRTNLLYLEVPGGVIRCLGVLGVGEGVGTSFVAAGLASATAALALPVVLVDADLRSPSIGGIFGVPDDRGLGDLHPDDDPTRLLLPAPGHTHLEILPAGNLSADPAAALSGRFREGFRDLVDRMPDADLIVVDTPPGGAFAETAAVAAQCDVCVVVIDRRTTRRKAALEAHRVAAAGRGPAGRDRAQPGGRGRDRSAAAGRDLLSGSRSVAIVHERFTELGGSERVVEQMHEVWPEASVHAAISDPAVLPPGLQGVEVHTSGLQRAYRGGRGYAALLPLLPLAMRRLDVGHPDAVVVSHHAFAGRIRPPQGVPVVAYVHTPARWIWDPAMLANEAGGRVGRAGLRAFAATQRRADRAAARRWTALAVNSRHVAERVQRCWGLESEVIHPPIDTGFFTPDSSVPRDDFFLLAGRLVPYKQPEARGAGGPAGGRPARGGRRGPGPPGRGDRSTGSRRRGGAARRGRRRHLPRPPPALSGAGVSR